MNLSTKKLISIEPMNLSTSRSINLSTNQPIDKQIDPIQQPTNQQINQLIPKCLGIPSQWREQGMGESCRGKEGKNTECEILMTTEKFTSQG